MPHERAASRILFSVHRRFVFGVVQSGFGVCSEMRRATAMEGGTPFRCGKYAQGV